MKSIRIAVGICFVAAVATGVAQGAAFQNGSFESPVLLSAPDFTTVPTGWVKNDPSCPSCIGLFMENYSTFGLPVNSNPNAGNQAFGFGGNGVISGSLSQTFDTIAGVTYQVSYELVIQQGFEQEAMSADVFDASNVSLASKPLTISNTAWQSFGFTFTADSATTTLRFSDTTGAVLPGVGGSTNWALDDVTVGRSTAVSGTPEPSTGIMLCLAAVALVLARWRRVALQRSKN